LQQRLAREDFEQMKVDYDAVVIAVGAQKPRLLDVPGQEKMVPAIDFLRQSKQDGARVGKRVVIIGAGNVGCDVATEAHRMGAEEITLIHYRKPPASGEEKEAAEAVGATFRWPCAIKAVTAQGVVLTTGEVIEADTIVAATGHEPDLAFLPETVSLKGGFVQVNAFFQTTDPQVFAIGDVVKLGFLTDAIGAGRKAAGAIADILAGKEPHGDMRQMVDYDRIRLEYFDPRRMQFDTVEQCAENCSSCGTCRDCGVCVAICPQGAISRKANGDKDFEMVVDPERCIGCGFCAGACPCGIWAFVENEPMG
ncbi:MAG: FAD-dependent oxidoreductase, partial [Thermodesulfobacteriota bacterium]|nr:FAD-dependent oxidoreductase [Thermodesulfobacteriota bacterium]